MTSFKEVKQAMLDDLPRGAGVFDVSPGSDGAQVIKFTPNKPPQKFSKAPFQLEDIPLMAKRCRETGGSANWSEMGAYKTTSGLWLCEELKCEKILIITTKTGKTTFFQTVPYVLPDYSLVNIESSSKLGAVDGKVVATAHFNLFQNRSKVRHLIAEVPWDMILVDEAHRIKNRDAQWTKNIKTLTRKARYRHVMTGTGFVNRPDEIWSLLNFLFPKDFTSYWRFRGHYCSEEIGNTPNGGSYRIVTGFKSDERRDEFRQTVRALGPRRTKKELFKDLPDVYTTIVPVDLNPVQRKMFDSMKAQLYMMDQKGYPITSPNVLSMLNRLRQVTVATPEVVDEVFDADLGRIVLRIHLVEPSSKLDALGDLLAGTDTPSVVFSNFNGVCSLVESRLLREKIPYLRLRAQDNDDTRHAKVQAFQEQKGSIHTKGVSTDLAISTAPRVFLSTIKLGGESITLTSADKLIFLDRDWSPAANNQAIARVHRPGQTSPVQVIQIEALHTTDQYLESKLKQKQKWFSEIFD